MIDARYALHGITLGLTWFGVVNAATAAIVLAAAARAGRREASRSAAFWLALRLLPAAASIAFVAVLFVPSYWRYEPRTVEAFDAWLGAFALAVFAVIGTAFARGCCSWYAASRRTHAWLQIARPIGTAAAIPAYEVPLDAPMMALAGVLRPRLVLTRGVVQALTADELRAAVAHEIGHLRAGDNLKRLAMRAAPDVLGVTRRAAMLEARWASAAEHEADRAAGGDGDTRCALASALVKVAKLTPLRTPIAEPISTLVDGGDIVSRVQRLLDDGAPAPTCAPGARVSVALAAGAVFAVSYAPLLRLVHEATELLVNAVP
jgi:Zn-dependent protease with chaperone function